MTRDEMIEVAARVCRTEYATILSRRQGDFDYTVSRFVGSAIIDALIAAGVIPDPETMVTVERGRLARLVEYVSWHRESDGLVLDFCDDQDRWNASAERGQRALDALTFGDLYPIPESVRPLAFDAVPCEHPNGAPVPYVAIGNGEPVPPALQALYESMVETWGKE